LAQLMAQQLQAMNQLFSQQLQLLTGGAAPAAAAPPAQAPQAAAPQSALQSPAPQASAPQTSALQTPAPQAAAAGGSAPQPPSAAPAAASATASVSAPAAPRRRTFDPLEPVQVDLGSGLEERQQRYLERFTAAYARRTARSKQLAAEHRRTLADNRWTKDFRSAWKEMIYPIQGNRGLGSRVWDVDGNEYVDIAMGFGLHLFGHSPEFLVRALREQLDTSLAVGPQSPVAGEAAQLLTRLTGLDRAIFVNSGTEAVMAALRAARTWSGRDRIGRFNGAYHGWSDATLVRGLEVGGKRRTLPGAPGVPAAAVENTVVFDWATPEGLAALEEEIDTLGAVIVEPVQSRRPDLQPREFLHEVRRITRQAGVPLILDEMVTGFRIHPRGAQGWFDVDADLAIYGKVLAGGLPLGALAGRAELMDVLDGGAWEFGDASYPAAQKTLVVGAYFKNPLTIAAVRATLRELEARGPAMQEELNARTGRLIARLSELFGEQRAPLEAIHCGSLFRLETTDSHETNQLFFFHLVQEGVFYTRETGNCFLSTAHTDADVDRIVGAVERSVAAMQEGGFFPPGPPGRRAPARVEAPPPAAVATAA
ncbi:MAG TPA: aminotransferase class III-fold pyridoxal phosphate-dependent enzyme, partial [Thermoanaerobaculia bacterium]|nr:aminotransferase class III-fold pyridoxal phosphate-dependent enzyme [Thermoanaerobaculia bacterium]